MLAVHLDLQNLCNNFTAHRLSTTALNPALSFAKASLISLEHGLRIEAVCNYPIIISKEYISMRGWTKTGRLGVDR
jgi:hypothetical protein